MCKNYFRDVFRLKDISTKKWFWKGNRLKSF